MKRTVLIIVAVFCALSLGAQEFMPIPSECKWVSNDMAVYSYDGSFADEGCFGIKVPKWTKVEGVKFPERYSGIPVQPSGAVNPTFSPDSSLVAFTRDGDLYVIPAEGGNEVRLTFDGGPTVYNGYASWVYYEEIFGRPSKYRAFWWSPDSRKIAFYRFDDTQVPMFPIYSPVGQDGVLRQTRYPKAGERNPEVKIGFIDLSNPSSIVWADFDPADDQYFGTPFWGADSRSFFVPREPRIQNTLDLYLVNVADGSRKAIYHETYPTWLDWIDGMLFSDKGLYMVRNFESGWQQAYFLSYDGSEFKRLTDGENWRMELLRVEKDGTLYFLAERDSRIRKAVYKVSPKGKITAVSDVNMNALSATFSPDGKYCSVIQSSLDTPWQVWIYNTSASCKKNKCYMVAEMKGPSYNASAYSLGKVITIENDGFELPGVIYFPKDFDPSKQYPVHVDIYGGPDTPMVHDRWVFPSRYQWYSDNGIIELVADCRASGHNGRAGLDMIYKHLNTVEVQDFIAWARYLQELPYVKADKIGVEGFSFGGTMTAMLVMTAPDAYHYGIAGGGVYDWMLYDTHYTERFMSTPQDNPEGYRDSQVLKYAQCYKVQPGSDGSVMLKLTHGTGDDNVHFQNTLQLIDALQKVGADFDFMIYPDGMHGYRGYQGRHDDASNKAFWLKYLKD
ncbi:MAG: DPP IV N-terminal domain-containing protein [Bacteroidales bacterium]|nr:DPP IV N-terminal domain-containing protein [Bacteroidales bacterium]